MLVLRSPLSFLILPPPFLFLARGQKLFLLKIKHLRNKLGKYLK